MAAKVWYDLMQVCTNGHKITAIGKSSPENLVDRCPECGTKMRGRKHKLNVTTRSSPDVPQFCYKCGNPYPWTKKKENAPKGPSNEQIDSFWQLIHPGIREVAKSRFEDGYHADSVEAALKAVNTRVKKYYKAKTGAEADGAPLMNLAFSPKNPIIVLDDLNTESGKSIQIGYMQIFAESITGIRNPKAHEVITITPERALHFLFLASLLMHKLDEGKVD